MGGQCLLVLIGLKVLVMMNSLQNIVISGAQGLLMLMGSRFFIKMTRLQNTVNVLQPGHLYPGFIPSFLSDGQLSGQQAIQSRLIASVCIKVENAIKCLKDFKIFSDMLCNCINKKQIDGMFIIVCALYNLKPRLTNN